MAAVRAPSCWVFGLWPRKHQSKMKRECGNSVVLEASVLDAVSMISVPACSRTTQLRGNPKSCSVASRLPDVSVELRGVAQGCLERGTS